MIYGPEQVWAKNKTVCRGEKGVDRNGYLPLAPSVPLSTIINFISSWNGLALSWVWPVGVTGQISEDGRSLRFGYSSGSRLPGLLIDNDLFCSGGHTSCLEALFDSYCGNSSISSFHHLFPFTFRPRMVKDVTVSSTVVTLYLYQFPLIQLRLWKRVPLLKRLQLPHFIVPSASCQDLARYNF